MARPVGGQVLRRDLFRGERGDTAERVDGGVEGRVVRSRQIRGALLGGGDLVVNDGLQLSVRREGFVDQSNILLQFSGQLEIRRQEHDSPLIGLEEVAEIPDGLHDQCTAGFGGVQEPMGVAEEQHRRGG